MRKEKGRKGEKKRKWEVKGYRYNKCKIRKNQGKKSAKRVKKCAAR
jgi:hypothetical protein